MKIQLLHVNMDGTTKERSMPSAQVVIAVDPAGRVRLIKDNPHDPVQLVRCGPTPTSANGTFAIEELPPYAYTGDQQSLLRAARKASGKAA